jgi:tRNA modification GTPase
MPNAGKSSIFNVLLKDERSIVNESPGTTRDTVSEFTDIGGIPVRLTDTAGMREGADRVERLGVERTRRAIADSDAVLLVVDAGFRRGDDDERLRSELGGWPCVVAFNKADLPPRWTPEERAAHAGAWPWADVSALTGAGMDRLRQLIGERFLGAGNPQSDGILITNLRHCRCLESAKAALQGAAGALRQGMSEEFVLADLHRALGSLGEITGETGVEELLSGIFSRFCVGK